MKSNSSRLTLIALLTLFTRAEYGCLTCKSMNSSTWLPPPSSPPFEGPLIITLTWLSWFLICQLWSSDSGVQVYNVMSKACQPPTQCFALQHHTAQGLSLSSTSWWPKPFNDCKMRNAQHCPQSGLGYWGMYAKHFGCGPFKNRGHLPYLRDVGQISSWHNYALPLCMQHGMEFRPSNISSDKSPVQNLGLYHCRVRPIDRFQHCPFCVVLTVLLDGWMDSLSIPQRSLISSP